MLLAEVVGTSIRASDEDTLGGASRLVCTANEVSFPMVFVEPLAGFACREDRLLVVEGAPMSGGLLEENEVVCPASE